MAMTEQEVERLRRRYAQLLGVPASRVADSDPEVVAELVAEMEAQLAFYASIGTPADVPEPEPEPAW